MNIWPWTNKFRTKRPVCFKDSFCIESTCQALNPKGKKQKTSAIHRGICFAHTFSLQSKVHTGCNLSKHGLASLWIIRCMQFPYWPWMSWKMLGFVQISNLWVTRGIFFFPNYPWLSVINHTTASEYGVHVHICNTACTSVALCLFVSRVRNWNWNPSGFRSDPTTAFSLVFPLCPLQIPTASGQESKTPGCDRECPHSFVLC